MSLQPEDIDQINGLIHAFLQKNEKDNSLPLIHPSQIPANLIKQRNIDGTIIKRGLSADRPTDGSAVGVYGYFATDTHVLSLWTGTAWKTTTLT